MSLPVLHVVTDDLVVSDDRFLGRAGAVLEAIGQRGALHLRGHALGGRRLYTVAAALAPVAARHGGWLVINDRVDIALAVGTRRVQLTARSLGPGEVRALPGAWEIGVSVHAPAEAVAAQEAGAAWVIAGSVFATPSHVGAGGGLAFVRAVARATALPTIAIGGIRPEAVGALRRAGAAGVAVIRGIWGADDAVGASIAYLTAYDAGGNG
jgi:thiamine-phosphate diphosphorylase